MARTVILIFSLLFVFQEQVRSEPHVETESAEVSSNDWAERTIKYDCGDKLGDVTVSDTEQIPITTFSLSALSFQNSVSSKKRLLHVKFNEATGGFSAFIENTNFGLDAYSPGLGSGNFKIHLDPTDGYIVVMPQLGRTYEKTPNTRKMYYSAGTQYGMAYQRSRNTIEYLNGFLDALEKSGSKDLPLAKRIVSCMIQKMNLQMEKYAGIGK